MKQHDLQIMVVVGSRAAPRSVGDSPVPIDVISAKDLLANGSTDVSTLLRTMTPSYNVNDQGISDGATIVRPANLRGLSPDSTLILVNGKRRHKGSVIAFSGSTFEVKAGQFSEGDGDLLNFSGNVGMELSERGFANFTFELNQQDPTSRSTQRSDAQGLIDAGNTAVRTPAAQVWGTPEISNDFKLFLNTGIELSNTSEAYLFGNWSEKTVEGGSLFGAGNPVDTVLVGDLTPGATDNSACPIVRLRADGIPDTPTDFTPGAYAQLEQALNADFSKDFDSMVVSYGAEFRRTQFTITAGDVASFVQGPLVAQGFSIGSNGFPGFQPADAGVSSRTSKAVYFDAEYDVSEDILAQAAFRYEYFSDFGSTFNWKLAGLYTMSDSLKIRASASTGFRAPTCLTNTAIGQANVRSVQTQFVGNELVDL